MPKSYRLIHGDAHQVERQLILLNAQNRAAEGKNVKQQKQILMGSTGVANPMSTPHWKDKESGQIAL